MSEQEIISKYFAKHSSPTENVELSVGDDGAIVKPPKDSKLVMTTDTLNLDVHFDKDCKSDYIGHKSLAVNLSDIAAMGATPLWATLSLSLPTIDHIWLQGFSEGLYSLADTYNVKIVGGDIVKGPLAITIHVTGELKDKNKLLRNGCRIDDLVYVSGNLGDAAMGLKIIQNKVKIKNQTSQEYFISKLHCPNPRLDVSSFISNISQAAIDISDGFFIDLQRMLGMSDVGADIHLENIPISEAMQSEINHVDQIKELLQGGEDYELIFTIKPSNRDTLENHFKTKDIKISYLGKITQGQGITLLHENKQIDLPVSLGFDHFK